MTTNWINKVLRFRKLDLNVTRPNAAHLDTTMEAARHMSRNSANRDVVIVVVEMAARFNVSTGQYLDREYNYYTHRGERDFNEISNLKAAFCNGQRFDDQDSCNSSRKAFHAHPDQEVRYVTYDRDALAVGGRGPNTADCHEDE